jgi:2-polyprenyl-3-methyl-5-hydroxy-6-metoxy-1,4-benzoquinol methylase
MSRSASPTDFYLTLGALRAMAAVVKRHVDLGGRILEVGCGPGHLLRALGQEVAGAVGVDMRADHLTSCRADGFRAVCGRAEALGIRAHRFDVVLCVGVLQLVPDHETAIAEMARVLRPDGILALSVLNLDGFCRAWTAMRREATVVRSISAWKDRLAVQFQHVEAWLHWYPTRTTLPAGLGLTGRLLESCAPDFFLVARGPRR